MARISLYIPDDLKARMDAAGDAGNWSDAARPALTAAAAVVEHSKGGNMQTAIERLRTSKKQAEQNSKTFGTKEGRMWASDQAEWRWLHDLRLRRENYPDEDPRHALSIAIDPDDDLDPGEIGIYCLPLSKSATDEYMEAFVEAAVNFYLEVREEVERD